MEHFFEYGQKETDWLKSRDKKLSAVIDQVGPIYRKIIPDLFAALVHSIVGQQISTKAQETVWQRFRQTCQDLSPHGILSMEDEELQSIGISFRKVNYIKRAAEKIGNGEFDIDALRDMDDAEVARQLSSLDGIGRWSAEMLMLFSMQRPNILSFDDLAIQRGLRMVYRHRKIDRRMFERYRRRYTPYGSVASLYLWAVAGGAIEGLTDPATKPTNKRRKPSSTTAKGKDNRQSKNRLKQADTSPKHGH